MSEQDTQGVFRKVMQGDEAAAKAIHDRFLVRLVALARSRLSVKLARKVDPDDIVQSAMRSFFIRARDGQFEIERGGELWSLLATITKTKLLKKAEHYRQQKRDINSDQPLAATDSRGDAVFADEPTETEAVALADEVEFLMRELGPVQRKMLELRLQGEPIPDIAQHIERSERTVRRFLSSFRDQLEDRLKKTE